MPVVARRLVSYSIFYMCFNRGFPSFDFLENLEFPARKPGFLNFLVGIPVFGFPGKNLGFLNFLVRLLNFLVGILTS